MTDWYQISGKLQPIITDPSYCLICVVYIKKYRVRSVEFLEKWLISQFSQKVHKMCLAYLILLKTRKLLETGFISNGHESQFEGVELAKDGQY